MDNKQLLSYSNLLDERKRFRGGYSKYDEPGLFYFKILFYFNNPSDEDGIGTSNLLGLDRDIDDIASAGSWIPKDHFSDSVGQQDDTEPAAYSANTAYNYLILNGENERAAYLKDFIYLLSEISANSPWYFKSVEGLENALDRPFYKEFKFEDTPRELTINCLQESIDNRIITLLELYRAACWSQRWKREVVPENLRKFDMGIYVFQTPINGLSYNNTDKKAVDYIDQNNLKRYNYNNIDLTSSMYFEFHNCEIDQNSIKTCFSAIDNSTGIEIEPKITISYEECITSTYNEFLCKSIGDLVLLDMSRKDVMDLDYESINNSNRVSIAGDGKYVKLTEDIIAKNIIDENKKPSLAKTIIDNTLGKATEIVKKTVRKAYLGNVYGLSIRNIVGSVEQITSGDLIGGTISTIKNVSNTVNSIKKGSVIQDLLPSLVKNNKTININGIQDLGHVYPQAQTIKNNL